MKSFKSEFLTALVIIICLAGCIESNPNSDSNFQETKENNLAADLDAVDVNYRDTVYVPIYSNVYSKTKDTRFLLTATLSIRNTSFTDTLLVNQIDYYDTSGKLMNAFIEEPIYLNPMSSIDYVIDEDDDRGGSGANFIVIWSAEKNINPLIQAVMISTNGQQGVGFTTDGYSIKN